MVRVGTWVDAREEELFGRRGGPEINRSIRRQVLREHDKGQWVCRGASLGNT